MSISGSCHCGKLAFTLEDEPTEVMQCNCSICQRKGYLLTFAPADQVTITADAADLAAYTFNHHNVQHQFCKSCGCAPFGTGKDGQGNTVYALNLRCADADLEKLQINAFDGAAL